MNSNSAIRQRLLKNGATGFMHNMILPRRQPPILSTIEFEVDTQIDMERFPFLYFSARPEPWAACITRPIPAPIQRRYEPCTANDLHGRHVKILR